ncbi:MAG: hypothetical protein WBH20_09885, partial [Oceanisphaera sp.]|uniref:hypothetical protein n=1 Tax=Oceanisphaera sp. TaxID=1929979 RepID=UPI003C73F5D1
YWSDRVQSISSSCRPKVGLIWRGGYVNGMRSSHYLNEKEISEVMQSLPGVEFFNCMYVDCKKELNYIQKKTGKKIHHFSELDQKNDIESTAAMLSNLDLLVGAYTATLSLSQAVGTPAVVYAADYLKEDGVLEKEAFHYEGVSHISLPVIDKGMRRLAIEAIIKNIKQKLKLI